MSELYPCPEDLVWPGWRLAERDLIVAYLRGGRIYRQFLGFAACYFHGCDDVVATADLTDGAWIWPQALEHYLVRHQVCLPDSFIETMRGNNWIVPSEATIRKITETWRRDGIGPSRAEWMGRAV
jgi:hypothetical protein